MDISEMIMEQLGMSAANFRSEPVVEWTQEHTEVPIFFVMAYLAMIFQAPQYMKALRPFPAKWVLAAWNAALALFSFMGFVNTVPVLLKHLQEDGFKYTVCTPPGEWYLNGHVGLYVFLFIYSKIPELMDTVFLVTRQRPVIFLHWFHHFTVLLYCWHAYHNSIASGLWFAAMNYTVHSVMYCYYMLTSLGVMRKLTKTVAPFITLIQILQMVMGMVVTASSAYWHRQGGFEECAVNAANYKMGIAMYSTYFILFAVLFNNLYFKPGGKHARKPAEVCGVSTETGDAAGHFIDREGNVRPQDTKKTK